MAFLGLILVVIYLVLNNASMTSKQRSKSQQMSEQGAFLPSSFARGNIIMQDVWHDWYGERKMFPEEYWPYLERNKKALGRYVCDKVNIQEIKEGFKPTYIYGPYNKYTFKPMGYFLSAYADKIKTYNETGVYYF